MIYYVKWRTRVHIGRPTYQAGTVEVYAESIQEALDKARDKVWWCGFRAYGKNHIIVGV
jgi:hypothetical protein